MRFETVVRPIPQFDPAQPTMISQGPSVCVFNKEDTQEVLASWLFVQYLLTDGIQIDYSSTEGYVPVTSKAQMSEDYQTYLSRRGEDNDEHYAVKIDAVNLLLSNMDNTFVTPVFNGSTSLRNAAGELIEKVAKSTRRKETVDDAYMEKLYNDVTSLYKLDGIGSVMTEDGSTPLPPESVALLSGLGGIWILMITYAVISRQRARARNKK